MKPAMPRQILLKVGPCASRERKKQIESLTNKIASKLSNCVMKLSRSPSIYRSIGIVPIWWPAPCRAEAIATLLSAIENPCVYSGELMKNPIFGISIHVSRDVFFGGCHEPTMAMSIIQSSHPIHFTTLVRTNNRRGTTIPTITVAVMQVITMVPLRSV